MAHYKWPSIEGLHNVRKSIKIRQETGWIPPPVYYRPKVKLHGTNAAVQIRSDYSVVAQSRSTIITPENDNMGFANWVKDREAQFQNLIDGDGACCPPIVLFGEFCGKGIMKGVAISEINRKIFAIFAIFQVVSDRLVYHPDMIATVCNMLPTDTYILPWYNQNGLWIDWLNHDKLEDTVALINKQVEEVEKCDPWVKETFGVQGTGEGLVYYPTAYPNASEKHISSDGHHFDMEWFSHNAFKAKGDKHKMVKKSAPAQIDPAVAENATTFAEMMLTDTRLEQAVIEGCDGEYSMKKMGAFLQWINHDCKKEGQDELEASNLEWKMVAKYVSSKAKDWYIKQIERS